MKRIVIEGMDSAGKSTLSDALHSEFHFLVTIVNKLGPAQDFDHWWPLILNTDHSPFVPMHDRFFYSELVYGEILRGYVKASGPVMKATAQNLRDNAFLIYCRPSAKKMWQTFNNKPQMNGVSNKFDVLINAYDKMMAVEANYYGPRMITYDFEEDDLRELIPIVERYLIDQ